MAMSFLVSALAEERAAASVLVKKEGLGLLIEMQKLLLRGLQGKVGISFGCT